MPFRGAHLALAAPGVRNGFFGGYDIEGMGEFILVYSTEAYFSLQDDHIQYEFLYASR